MASDRKKREEFIEKCTTLTVDTIQFCRTLHKDATLWPIINQVVRSVGSIGANVVEGQGAGTGKDFTNFLRIAYKSAQESQYWYAVLQRCEPQHHDTIDAFLIRAQEVASILASSLRTLNKSH